MNLLRFFPTYQDLEAAPVPTVADKMLRQMVADSGPDGTKAFNIRNTIWDVASLYDGRWECGRAASEAFAWLIAKQYVALAPKMDVGWYCLSRSAFEAAAQASIPDWTAERELPVTWLHPLVASEALDHFRQGKFATAVFVAFRALEVEIRSAANLGPELVGTKLVGRAFNPEDGPLTDKEAEGGEKQALLNLMSGAIGSYKNPTSHRHVDLSGHEAREMLVLASHLIKIVLSRRLANPEGGTP